MATPGALIPMPSSGGALAGGAGVCADTLRAYGTPAADAPFGFGFYNAPDQGSVDFLMTQLAGQQDLPAAVIGADHLDQPGPVLRPRDRRGEQTPDLGVLPAQVRRLLHRREQPVLPDRGVPALPGRRRGERRRNSGDHRLPDLERERDHPEPGHRDDADDAGGGRPRRRGSRSPGRGGPPRTAGTAGRVDRRRGRRQDHPAGRDDVLRRPRGGRTDRRPGRRRHPRPADRRRCHRRRRPGPGSGDLRGGVLRAGSPQMHGRRRRRRVGQNPRVDPRGRRVHAGSGHDRPVDDDTAVHPGRHLRRPGPGVLPDLPAGRGADAPARADLARVLRPDRVGRGDGSGRCVPHHADHGSRRGDDVAEHRRRRRNRVGGFPGVGEARA